VLELAAPEVVEECFAVSEEWLLLLADAGAGAEVVGWLDEVAAEARSAMLRVKRAVSFISLEGVVLLVVVVVLGMDQRAW
jgi:hypothetical protein